MTRSRDLANLADGTEFTAADHTKLDGIETSATADQTDAEIRAAVEAATDSNVFTDADHSKLNAIEASATADQTDAEIRAAVEAATDSNVFTDADHSKLNAVEASSDVTDTANVTAAGALMDSELTNIAAVKALNQGLATTDEVAFDNTSLNAIATDISDTAVDVFVYDTSKDSDGGAWRKRTQNTSWYNEAASSTRGSRKEFPAVAVIVLEAREITIYDGDDPDMPMWMVFNIGTSVSTNSKLLGYEGSSGFTSIAALNGILTFGDTFSVIGVFKAVNFISDSAFAYNATVSHYASYPLASGSWVTGIGSRNTHGGYSGSSVTPVVVNADINDVAMTVLPNAPIDYATGLPVPTIAIASNGGVSVIKDDGTVVDITQSTSYNTVREIDFTYNNKIIYTMDNGDSRSARVDSIPSSDFVVTSNQLQQGSGEEFYNGAAFGYFAGDLSLNVPNGTSITKVVGSNLNDREIATTNGMTKIALANQSDPSSGMTNFITSSYNTGWQVGDIKLATLSDTDDTNVTGAELVTGWVNGSTYAYDTLSTSGSTISSAITDGSSFAGVSSNAMSLTAGKEYTVSFALTINSGAVLTYVFFATAQTGGGSLGLGNYLVNIGTGNHSLTFTAPSTGTFYLTFQAGNGVTTNFTTGAVSVRLAEKDRSVNGNGVQVFGTVTKTAVETGADLVAYSGFNASTALIQPTNSNILNLTKRSFVIWSKATKGNYYQYFWTLTEDSSYRYGLAIFANNGYLYTYDQEHGVGQTSCDVATGEWQCIVMTDDETHKRVYVNGVLKGTFAQVYDLNSSGKASMRLRIGNSLGGDHHHRGSLALFRVSGTILSPEQIAKIYNDEKHLFQAGAQATLYASSDAVTALAHDAATDLLHVGTEAGRSTFQGLRRVENTTAAVGATISASNGLVAED